VAGTETASHTIGSRLARVGNAYLDVVRSPSYFPLWLGQLVSTYTPSSINMAGQLLFCSLAPQRELEGMDCATLKTSSGS
jgi:hypothetical protein